MRRLAALVLVGILATACSGTPPAGRSPAGVTPASPSARATSSIPNASRGATPEHLEEVVVGGDRPVVVHVPPGYDAAHPAPLLVVLHGYGSSGREHEAYFSVEGAAAARGYLTAYPDGTVDSQGNRFWNATDACCDFDRNGIDDVAYLDSVIAAIDAKLRVDPKRIDLLGHSNGGFFSYAMACAHADRIAAIVSLAGATFAHAADCKPSEPVGVVEVHATTDEVIAFDGGAVQIGNAPLAPYPGAEATTGLWAKYDGCHALGAGPVIDVDADIEAGGSAAETTVTRWSGCDPGGAVELWTIAGGSHAPTLSPAFATATLDFFDAHPKP